MDENSSAMDRVLRQEEEEQRQRLSKQNRAHDSNGWQTVTYPKRHRRQSRPQHPADPRPNSAADAFHSLELHSEDRRRRALAASSGGENLHSDEDGEDGGSAPEASAAVENEGKEVKKTKQKKPKQPKVTVAEAASKMDAADLSAYLVDVTVSKQIDCQIR